MSAKLIYSITDENPDLQKQIGCMNGIFQLFDRHHFLSGRRIHKRLPPGQSGNHEMEPKIASQKAKEKNPKAAKEKQRNSTESSRTSFSSSSCSSTFSSHDSNKIAQPEPSSFARSILHETPCRDLPLKQQNASLQLHRQSLDLRDVVKDSIYREARGLSVKTATKEEAVGHAMKHIDSPRPLHLSQSVKPRVSGLNESFRVLGKLGEAPWNSNEEKDGSRTLARKDAPRFSYDGRESRDTFKSTIKLKELPRLSLDSREGYIRRSTSELKSKSLVGDLHRGNGNSNKIPNQQQEPGSNKRPSSVVAKLMGLEDFPESMSTNEGQMVLIKSCSDEDIDLLSRTTDERKQNRITGSPRNSLKDPASPQLRNVDPVMKPNSSSRFPIEPAPWRQQDGSWGSQKPAFKYQEAPRKARNYSPSVYGEIEKRLTELEFKKSGKDLRALKQILESMQKTKEILETKKEDQASNFVSQTSNNDPNYSSLDQSSKVANRWNLQSNCPISATIKGTSPPKNFESPIVIIKPAKLIKKSSNPPSATTIDGLSGLRKLRTGDSADIRKDSVDKRTTRDLTPRNNHLRDPSSRPLGSVDKNTSSRTLRSTQSSKEPQQMTRENATISGRSSGNVSPRLQQKKLALEKQPRPTTPSSDSSRARRQSSKQPMESGSPGRKLRPKSPNLQQGDDQLSEFSSETRNLSLHGDTVSVQSESNYSLTSQIDTEVTSTERCDEINAQKHKNPAARLSKDRSMAELATATPEQPSPVSVLDAAFYRDDSPSPVKKISNAFKDDETLNSDEAEWNPVDINHFSDSIGPTVISAFDHEKLQNINHLVQKLRRLNSDHDEATIDFMASFCENKNPDHRYISEILLTSSLLGDLGSGSTTIQLHSSGHLINPNLFHVLEHTKGSTGLSNDEHSGKKISQSKPDEKIQRKLVFDAVNEILVHKLALGGSFSQLLTWPNKLTRRKPSGQQLLRELCSEIDRLQANNSCCSLDDDDENDVVRSIMREDLMHQSDNWTDFRSEFSGVVLDVERLIFKDLVSEVVSGETADLQARPSRHCRQLFSK